MMKDLRAKMIERGRKIIPNIKLHNKPGTLAWHFRGLPVIVYYLLVDILIRSTHHFSAQISFVFRIWWAYMLNHVFRLARLAQSFTSFPGGDMVGRVTGGV